MMRYETADERDEREYAEQQEALQEAEFGPFLDDPMDREK